MIENVSDSAAYIIPQGQGLKLNINQQQGSAKLDIEDLPVSKVKISPEALAGEGKGLKIDIKV